MAVEKRIEKVAEDYTYIVARLRSLEAAMPDRAWFERLARTPVGGILNTLREYFKGFEPVDSPFKFEDGLDGEKAADMNLLSSLIADEGTRTFLRAGYDFDNAIRMWKANRLGAEASFYEFGQVGVETLELAVTGRDWTALPGFLKAFLERLQSADESIPLVELEYMAETAKWRFLLDIAPGREARAYARTRIDLANIKNFIRLKRTSLRKEALDAVWIEGGGIEAARLAGLFKGTEDEFYSFLQMTDYRGLIVRGLGKEAPLWRVDTILKQHLLEVLGESRYSFFDLSPVLYYIELAEGNYQLVRAILSGKLNEVPESIILERVEGILPA